MIGVCHHGWLRNLDNNLTQTFIVPFLSIMKLFGFYSFLLLGTLYILKGLVRCLQ
jgi:hypothetical protein